MDADTNGNGDGGIYPIPGSVVFRRGDLGPDRGMVLLCLKTWPPPGPPDQSGPIVVTARVAYQSDGHTDEFPADELVPQYTSGTFVSITLTQVEAKDDHK